MKKTKKELEKTEQRLEKQMFIIEDAYADLYKSYYELSEQMVWWRGTALWLTSILISVVIVGLLVIFT